MVKKAKRWIAGALTVLMVGGLLPHYVLNAEEPAAETEEITEEAVVEETAVEETVIEETVEEEPAVVEETAEETVVEETVEEEAEEGIVGETVEEPVAEVPAEETVTEEPAQPVEEAVVEEETVEEAETVEGANATSAVVRGYKWWYGTYFSADLRDYSVEVSGSTSAFGNARFMRVQLIEDDGLAAAVNSEYQELTDYTAFSVEFLDKKGRPVQLKGKVDVDVTANVNGTEYAWYLNDNGSWRKASDSLRISGAVSIAKVALNGIVKLEDKEVGGTGVRIDAEPGAFPVGTTVAVEAAKDNKDVIAAVDALDGGYEIVDAVDITFDHEGEEVQPADGKTVGVVIAASEALDPTKEYKIVHIGANGAEELDAEANKVVFDYENNKVTFEADSFSVYAIVWNDESGNEQSATIIWGYTEGETFVELEEGSTVTLDTTASIISLENSYEGYLYLDTVYCTEGQAFKDGVDIESTLTKTANGWTCNVISTEDGVITPTPIAANSTIYVSYFKPGPGEVPGPGSDDDDIPSPTTEKTVIDNEDGTYTIQLDITGKEVTEDQSHYANVLVILDATRSMNGAKWTNAKAAMKALIETLTEGDNAANAGKIDFALVTFGRSATVTQNWTKNNTAFKATCAGINMVTTSGTNWEAGMRGGLYGVLNSYPEGETEEKHDPTYVIFLTDGDPNVYYSSGADTNYTNTGTTYGYSQNANTSADKSKDEAKAIAAKTKLYGIYCGDSGTTPSGESFNRLVNVITGQGQGGQKTIAANANTIESEFKKIAETMLKEMGASNATVDDGVPSLAGISANVTGEAGGYEYYIKGKDDEDFSEWENAPGAIYSNDNGVTWDLGSVGTLEAGTTYRIKFTVWPSQAAYDLIADLNNGLKDYDDLSDKEKAAVTGSKEDGYTLVTNTHLNTRYTFKDVEYSDTPEELQYKAMPLPTKTVSVLKDWPENMIDQYGAAIYRDPVTGETKTATEIKLKLQRDAADYLEITVKSSEGWKKDDIYISCGNMTVDSSGKATIHEAGHDYQIVEPPEFMYYWDLISDIYHPMVINGVDTLLVLDVDATSDDVDNETYFAIGKNEDGTARIYKKRADSESVLKASNYRRSNLNLTKQIFDYDGETAITDENAEFTYTVTVKDSYSSDGFVWFSAWDPDSPVYDTDWVISGATPEAGNTGYWYAANGATITFKIKAGWNVRFLNLYHGTTFSFEETGMPNNYEFSKVEAATSYDFVHASNADWYKAVEGSTTGKITGTITEPNNSYTVTYSNKAKAEFYIYHSGVAADGNLETIPMTEVAADGTYNLYAKATAGTLYGGYYLDYAGKGDYKDDGVKGTTGVAYTGMNYTWSDPQTVTGTAMKPAAGETYYIKEVPTYYLRNYYQINYMKGTGELKALYLISALDDANYQEAGFTLKSTDNQKAEVVKTMMFRNYATNKSVTLKANTVFRSLGITGEGSDNNLLDYYDSTGSAYFTVGSFTMLPYWKTPDGITVNGISTRTVTITSLTKSGISKSDS